MNTIENLTSEALNAVALILADEVHTRGVALHGRTAVAYAAAMKNCANARDVEVLENLLAITSGARLSPDDDFYLADAVW